MIEAYMVIHGIYNKECTLTPILSHNITTRGHSFKLLQINVHSDIRKYFFINIIKALWNHLPDELVAAKTLNIFNNRLDKQWSNQECKFHWKAHISVTGGEILEFKL